MIFIFLYVLSFIIIRVVSRNNVYKMNSVRFEILCVFVLLFCFFGFRDLTVLNDTVHYYDMYQSMVEDVIQDKAWYELEVSRIEPGFQIFQNLLGKLISTNPYTIIFVSSLLFTIFFLVIIKHLTREISLTTYVFLTTGILLSYYSAIRQTFAVLISIVMYIMLTKNNKKSAIICWLLAISFHVSAIIAIFPYIISKFKFSKIFFIFLFLSFFLFSFFIYKVLAAIGMGDITYVTNNLERETTPYGQALNSLMIMGFFAIYYYIYKKFCKDAAPNKLFLSYAIACVFVEIVSVQFQIFVRFELYFVPYVILLAIRSLDMVERSNIKYRAVSIMILLLFFRFVVVIMAKNEWYHLVPYDFFDFSADYHDLTIDKDR